MNDFKKGLLVGIVIMSSIFLFIGSTAPQMWGNDSRKIVEYNLIGTIKGGELSDYITQMISEEDWQPFGSPFIHKFGSMTKYYQTLVKYK
jgi:hypothetical protein